MRVLLDTHIALWALTDDPRLSARARLLIEDAGNDVLFSLASAWEVAIKHAAHPDKMLVSGADFMILCAEAGFVELPVVGSHVAALETLRRADGVPVHNDPFDRIMLAQAKADGLLFVTHDSLINGYGEACVIPV